MHSLQQVFGCLQSAIGYWLLAIGDRLFGASLRRAPKMLTGEPEDPAIIGYVCIGSSVLRLRRRVCRTQKRPSGFVGQDGVPGLSDVASGLPDVAPGVSNDGAKSGYPPACPPADTGAQFGQGAILEDLASPTRLFEHEHGHERRTPNAKTPYEALGPGTSRSNILLDSRF